MSQKALKFLEEFLPFFVGINVSLFSKAKPLLAKAGKGIYIYNIEEGTFTINSNYKNNAKIIDTFSYIEDKFPWNSKRFRRFII